MAHEYEQTREFRGASFRQVDLSGATFREVDLSGVTVRDADVRGLRITASMVDDVHLSGHEGVGRVVVDDVEVGDLVRAELDRRHPERVLVREARTVGDLRRAWAQVERGWDDLLDQATALPAGLLEQRVDDEWSFLETLRHLAFAVDTWVGRVLHGGSEPSSPLGMPPTDLSADAAAEMGLTLDARPTVDEVVALHRASRARVTGALAEVTDADLTDHRTAVMGADWGEETHTVLDALRVVLKEHVEHLRFARRDLARLPAG